jgi:DNA-binding response OmpR family regulator
MTTKNRPHINFGPKARILCIDDETSWTSCLTEILGRAGYTCDCCHDGATARDYLLQRTPDLIIADIDLGKENGLQLCEAIRAMPTTSETPVLFVSGADIEKVVERCHEAGGTYYLRKPFDPEVLLDLVDRALWMPHVIGNHVRESADVLR